jgi:hypothetical protein
VAAASIQLGQVWRRIETGDNWLVTKLYSEALASYAVLRKVGGSDRDIRRVKVTESAKGVALLGFVFTAGSEPF